MGGALKFVKLPCPKCKGSGVRLKALPLIGISAIMDSMCGKSSPSGYYLCTDFAGHPGKTHTVLDPVAGDTYRWS